MMTKAEQIIDRLEELYPKERDTHPLDYKGLWQLLIGTILSARNRDDTVNKATPGLFAKWGSPEELATADVEEIKKAIATIGMTNTKAKNIKKCAEIVNERHSGKVPSTREELEALPGVGRKTANIVLMYGFDKPALAVDTHVHRISNRTGIAKGTVKKVEEGLSEILPEEKWWKVNRLLIAHGRKVCRSQGPKCSECTIADLCEYNLAAASHGNK